MNIYQAKHSAYMAYAAYVDGVLSGLEVVQSNFAELDAITNIPIAPFPLLEADIELMAHKPVVVIALNTSTTLVERMNVQAKIRLWCAAYKKYRNCTYTVSTKEKANMAKVPMSNPLLAAYFTCTEYWATTNHYDLGTYIREINKIRDFAKNGQFEKPKSTWPNEYSAELMKRLEPAQVQAYQEHLRALGFSAKKDAQGRVIKWSK